MPIPLKEIAVLVDGIIIGNENISINNVSKIEDAKANDITFIYLPAYEKFFDVTAASAVIVKRGFNKSRQNITLIEVDAPEKAILKIINKYFSPEFNLEGIDSSASVHPSARLGKNVALGKNVVVSSGCIVGDNTKIYHNTVLYENVEIAGDSLLFSNISVRENCKIGSRVIIHSGTVIGSDGFGFNPDEAGVYKKIPQIGNVVLEDDVEIGSNVSIDRAAMGSTIIKRGTKIDNLVQIAHNVIVGEDTVISSQSGISGSTKVGNNCIIAGQVGLVGHIEIGDKVVLTAQSGISKSITKPGYYFGTPAKEIKTARILEAHFRNLPDYSKRIKILEDEITKLKELLRENLKV